MKEKKCVSGQALIGKYEAAQSDILSGGKSEEFRVKWLEILQSPIFLVFALRVTAVLVAGGYIFSRFIGSMIAEVQNNPKNQFGYIVLCVAVIAVLYLAVNAVGTWMLMKDASNLEKKKIKAPGLMLIMWANRVMLVLMVAAFMVTLPFVSEGQDYVAANDIYLELIYIAFALMGLWSAAVMVVSQKIWEKLTIWNNGVGPVKAMAVVCMLIRIAVLVAMFSGAMGTVADIICLPVFAASGILSMLLFIYDKTASKIL